MTTPATSPVRFEIIARTDFAETTIITIVDHFVPTHTWTLVSDSDGRDVLVSPSGAHVECDRVPTNALAADVLDWIMNNV